MQGGAVDEWLVRAPAQHRRHFLRADQPPEPHSALHLPAQQLGRRLVATALVTRAVPSTPQPRQSTHGLHTNRPTEMAA
jgi:hypothetical protein